MQRKQLQQELSVHSATTYSAEVHFNSASHQSKPAQVSVKTFFANSVTFWVKFLHFHHFPYDQKRHWSLQPGRQKSAEVAKYSRVGHFTGEYSQQVWKEESLKMINRCFAAVCLCWCTERRSFWHISLLPQTSHPHLQIHSKSSLDITNIHQRYVLQVTRHQRGLQSLRLWQWKGMSCGHVSVPC